MRDHWRIVLILSLLTALGGPLLLALAGLARRGQGAAASGARRPFPWRLAAASGLCCVIAFNLVFFVQELFLVLAKAVTPGLHPVLFHNNHDWTGSNPLAELEQGSGALASLLLGLAAMAWLARTASRSAGWRLLAWWLAFNGLYGALPQLVVAAMVRRQDTGRAMDYLGLPLPAIWLLAALALAGMAAAGMWLARALPRPAEDTAGGGGRYVLRAATLPGVLAYPLILLFRVPGDPIQVAAVPAVILLAGLAWVQAWAWRGGPKPVADLTPPSVLVPLAATALLLAVFQLVLRPGIAF